MNIEQKCKTCCFCRLGECHRMPPVYAMHGRAKWLNVTWDDWCGEWQDASTKRDAHDARESPPTFQRTGAGEQA